MEKKLAHLEMIQGVANRLSPNSFLPKGGCVVLVSGLFALSAGDRKTYFIYCFEDGVLGAEGDHRLKVRMLYRCLNATRSSI